MEGVGGGRKSEEAREGGGGRRREQRHTCASAHAISLPSGLKAITVAPMLPPSSAWRNVLGTRQGPLPREVERGLPNPEPPTPTSIPSPPSTSVVASTNASKSILPSSLW